jgi:hypothetical protein
VIVWDKVLGLGSTDPIAGDVAQWAGAIVTTYVGGRSLEKIARSVATVWRRPIDVARDVTSAGLPSAATGGRGGGQ